MKIFKHLYVITGCLFITVFNNIWVIDVDKANFSY